MRSDYNKVSLLFCSHLLNDSTKKKLLKDLGFDEKKPLTMSDEEKSMQSWYKSWKIDRKKMKNEF